MLDQLKQLKNLYAIQKTLSETKIEAEENGNKLVLNGKMEILELILSDLTFQAGKEEIEKIIKKLHEQAMKKIQQVMTGHLGGLGGIL